MQMNLKGLNTYQDLQSLYEQMGSNCRFAHKKGQWTIKRFAVAYNKESEIPHKTVVSYDNGNRRYEVQIKNLHKHFEIVGERCAVGKKVQSKKECMICGNTNASELELETMYSDGEGNDDNEKQYICKEGKGCC